MTFARVPNPPYDTPDKQYQLERFLQALSRGLGNITSVGTVTSGTWNGSVIGPAYGGTGVANNAAATLTRTGNHALTLTTSNTTSLTLPTSGTVATTSNKLSDFAATTSAELAGVLSDETGSGGGFVRATSPTITTPNIVGTATNDNAAAGSVGEYVESKPGGVNSDTTADKNYTSISLTAGDWDVQAMLSSTASGVNTNLKLGISTTSATFAANVGEGFMFFALDTTNQAGGGVVFTRLSLSATTTVYLVFRTFGANSSFGGTLSARRIR